MFPKVSPDDEFELKYYVRQGSAGVTVKCSDNVSMDGCQNRTFSRRFTSKYKLCFDLVLFA